jgi:hypothetical protein
MSGSRTKQSAARRAAPQRKENSGNHNGSARKEVKKETESKKFPESNPSPLAMVVALTAVIVLGHFSASYIADPSRISGDWRYCYAVLMCATVGLSVSTLTIVGYCLIALRSSELSQKLFETISTRSVIGAVLGSLLGLRLAESLPKMSFPVLIGDVGTLATVFTLVMIATCWPFAWGPAQEAAQSIVQALMQDIRSLSSKVREADKTGSKETWAGRGHKGLAFLIVLSANATGLPVAISVYRMIA